MMSKQKILLLFVALIIVILGIVGLQKFTEPGDNKNLVNNGDFEKWSGNRPSGWNIYDYQREYKFDKLTSEYRSDSANKSSGNKSIFIENKEANDLRLKQIIKVKPSTTYKISCYFKVDGVIESGDGANISIIDNSIRLGSSITRDTNSQWKEVVVYGKTGKNQKELELAVGLGGYSAVSKGKIWIDNVRFEEVGQAPSGAVVENLFVSKADEKVHKNFIPPEIDKVIFLVFAFLLILYIYNIAIKKLNSKDKAGIILAENDWRPGKKLLKKADWIIMIVMTLTYLVGALYNLGDMKAPQTYYASKTYNEYVTVSFGETKKIERILYSCNLAENNSDEVTSYVLEYLDENNEFVKFCEFKEKDFYEWKLKDTSVKTSQIKIITQNPGFKINEIGFFEESSDSKTGFKLIENVQIIDTDGSKESFEKWFDEQDTVPVRPSHLNGTYFDEIYFPRTAYENLNRLPVYETTHPPLGKVIQAIGIAVFQMTPFGWRIMGTLFGAAMLPVMYAFAKKLFNKSLYAFIATFLFMFDTMHFAQTRLATIDSYSVFFIMLMYYYMYDVFISKSYEHKMKHTLMPLFLSGLFFGLGSATKWICVYAGFGLAILFFLSKYLEIRSYLDMGARDVSVKEESWYKRYWINNVNTIFWCAVLFFVVIPATIYLLSYIPYTTVEGFKGDLIDVALTNQKSMLSYHSKLTAPHGYSSEWFTWPVIGRPIWYYNGDYLPSGIRETIASFGNPLVWLPGIFCLFSAMYIAMKKRDSKMLIVFVAFACQFMPWILVTRAVFIYHYFSCVPFIILSTVYVIKHLREKDVLKPWAIGLYLAAVAIVFFIFYPAISGLPVAEEYIEKLRLLPSWYF